MNAFSKESMSANEQRTGLHMPGLHVHGLPDFAATLYGPCAPQLVQGETPTCVCLGNFDGVHLGHRALIDAGIELAHEERLPLVVVTFEPHPLAVLRNDAPQKILDLQHRLEAIDAAGADAVLLLPFSRELAALPPDVFVEEILIRHLRMRRLVLGHDFSMGRNRAGNAETLARLGRETGFAVKQIPPFCLHGQVISSTLIRRCLAEGRVADAAAFLGRPHHVDGLVIHGMARGRTLGFPTANLAPTEVMLPARGVYATYARLSGPEGATLRVPAVTNIGHNPTFGPAACSVESHLLDMNADLYGQRLSIEFVDRLRNEQRFDGPDALCAQIRADVALARAKLCS